MPEAAPAPSPRPDRGRPALARQVELPRVVGPNDSGAALRQLLRIEAELRRAENREQLELALVNEGRKLLRARQVLAVRLPERGTAKPQVERISGLAAVEKNAPLVQWLQAVLRERLGRPDAADLFTLNLRANAQASSEADGYPFPHALWAPLKDRDGRLIAGLLFTRETPWGEDETALAARLAETGAHALLAVSAAPRRRLGGRRRKGLIAGLCLAGLAALAIPVPMTVLAPAEIVAERPFVLAAPLDGVIEVIVPAPNSPVAVGDVVIRYVDTALRNGFQVAERDVAVAETRLRQNMQGAFFDEKARREVGQARAELALKVAERDYAQALFSRTQVRAERAGVAVYGDRKEWFGKPVTTGQRILEIADPRRVEVRIDLPVSDAVALQRGTAVRIFPDADPLRPIAAEVTVATPLAKLTEAGVLAYRLTAKLTAADAPPRLGMRGTAQLFGETVPLGLYLFRKPLSWSRQKLGL
ncbi:efflux RND transporter periplasmic adaptor subunit [Methylobacterium iners]|uniref:HlyD family efflux transporter periplasmic adaptor subunit n=1 Tax=Methylobacterium iners TaxID=418707 RepID=A0ABQ4RXZ4_9HYPH|nr:HlyD family efflux transporter periplasmic adaptor subunit [Methylobacterium iners]GJD94847.1 hypothetical protein OCOJLMKI_2053 [Methylobacterium iners]